MAARGSRRLSATLNSQPRSSPVPVKSAPALGATVLRISGDQLLNWFERRKRKVFYGQREFAPPGAAMISASISSRGSSAMLSPSSRSSSWS